jgi:hypothetical protein
MVWCDQVVKAERDGDKVKLTVEPAKGGDSEELEAEVVLVSAGAFFSSAPPPPGVPSLQMCLCRGCSWFVLAFWCL